jgi:hypothetical protein
MREDGVIVDRIWLSKDLIGSDAVMNEKLESRRDN